MGRIELSPVTHEAHEFLYDLLRDRDSAANISHREMPTWEQHVAFVESNPYSAWYIVQLERPQAVTPIGSAYLTTQNEIGLFFFKEFQGKGYGSRAIKALMDANPRDRYLANVAPGNDVSMQFFVSQGFRRIQTTLELRPA